MVGCRRKRLFGIAGRKVEWYFAERRVADYFRNAFKEEGFNNITVFYQPPVKS